MRRKINEDLTVSLIGLGGVEGERDLHPFQ